MKDPAEFSPATMKDEIKEGREDKSQFTIPKPQ